MLAASVVVITRNRPAMLADCLDRLADQGAAEILVVDASDGAETRDLVTGRAGVRYLDFRGRVHQMPASRNLGIAHASGDVVAFLDDDSMAHPGWLAALVAVFADPAVGAAGGRAIDEHEPTLPDPTMVGRLLPDGTRIDNFNADPGRVLDVDRVRGCNMAFRRELLLGLGGFDRAYSGSNVNEAGDMCLRIGRSGYKVRYEPRAVVDHLSAPREAIPRDPATWRTQFYLARNRTYLLLKSLGPTPAVLRTLLVREIGQALAGAGRNGLCWTLSHLAGKAAGLGAAMLPRRTGIPRPG
ncbi:MAG: glycosyltransferase [Candidatus Sericytochromatia bacterium]|nr:glycosyltransferase [Candidatus Tanganyikabacteria bacterium]